MLLSTAIVRTLMRNRRDDCGLVVVPSMRSDTGPLADQGVSTIGANQKARRDGVVAGKLHLDRICVGGKAGNRRRAQLHAERFCLFRKRINKMTILDHMR